MKTYDVLVICHEDGKDEIIFDRKGDKAVIVNSNSGIVSEDGIMHDGQLSLCGDYNLLCRMAVSVAAQLYLKGMGYSLVKEEGK